MALQLTSIVSKSFKMDLRTLLGLNFYFRPQKSFRFTIFHENDKQKKSEPHKSHRKAVKKYEISVH